MTQIIYSTRAYLLVAENHTATISSATETYAAHIPTRQNRISIGVFELCVRVCVWVWCYSYCSLPCCRPANYSCNQAFESHNNWHATVTTAATTRVKWFLDKSKIYNNKKQQQNTPHIEKEPLWNLFPGGYRPIPYHFLEFLFRSKMIIILFLSTVTTFNAWTCEMVRIFILFSLEWSVSSVVTQHQFGHWKSCCFYWRKWSHLHSSQTHTHRHNQWNRSNGHSFVIWVIYICARAGCLSSVLYCLFVVEQMREWICTACPIEMMHIHT